MTTHTLTRRDIEAVDMLLEQLAHRVYVDAVLTTERHVSNLKSIHRGHFFDAEAVRFFGSRNMHLHRPGVLVETRTNTPGGTSWGVWAWTVNARFGVEPSLAGAFDSLAAARRFAERVHVLWPLFTACLALRLAGCPGTVDELIELTALTGVAS